MKLSNKTIQEVTEILGGIRITRVGDRGLRKKLLDNYLALNKVSVALTKDAEAVALKFNEDWSAELPEVRAKRKRGERLDDEQYGAFLSAEKDANDAILKISSGETEVQIEPVSSTAFMECIVDDLSLSAVGYLVDNGLLK